MTKLVTTLSGVKRNIRCSLYPPARGHVIEIGSRGDAAGDSAISRCCLIKTDRYGNCDGGIFLPHSGH
jgi:hypothetical protein